MVMGRKPKPTKQHELEGTFRPTRHGRRKAVKVQGSLAEPPSWMSPMQKQCWTDAIAHAPQDVLARIDASVIVAYAVAYARLIEASQAQWLYEQRCFETGLDPLYMETKGGSIVQSPYLGIINRATDKLMKVVAELGFTPVSRTRLSAALGDTLDLPPAGSSEEQEAGDDFDRVIAIRPKLVKK